MVTSERKAEIQIDSEWYSGDRADNTHENRVVSSGVFRDGEQLPLLPAVMAARALAEVFGIKNAVLLPAAVTRR